MTRMRVLAAAMLVLFLVSGWRILSDSSSTTSTTPGSQTTSPVAPAPPGGKDPVSGLTWVVVADLPPEARDTLRRIDRGGPFRYSRDGVVFANREGILPSKPRGFYHEYTVPTPGSRDRGARRLVTGDGTRLAYYTEDHYRSFQAVKR